MNEFAAFLVKFSANIIEACKMYRWTLDWYCELLLVYELYKRHRPRAFGLTLHPLSPCLKPLALCKLLHLCYHFTKSKNFTFTPPSDRKKTSYYCMTSSSTPVSFFLFCFNTELGSCFYILHVWFTSADLAAPYRWPCSFEQVASVIRT